MNFPRTETLKRELLDVGIVHLLVILLVLAVLLLSSPAWKSLFSGAGAIEYVEAGGPQNGYR